MIADHSMLMIDDGAARADLASRSEIKYVFNRADVSALRHVLLRSCKPIQHAGPVSTVRSVYFDDARLSTCRANLDGVGLRHKTRVRWYDSIQPTQRFHLEYKWRRHRVCGKHRFEISSAIPPGDMTYREFRARLMAALDPGQAIHLVTDSEPIVLVEYRREHFALRAGGTRLTLDYDLHFYPQLGLQRISHRFGERYGGTALIECKAAVGGTAALRAALAPLRVRPSRFSKYVTGCQALGYLHIQ